jgi:hypothetical protein
MHTHIYMCINANTPCIHTRTLMHTYTQSICVNMYMHTPHTPHTYMKTNTHACIQTELQMEACNIGAEDADSDNVFCLPCDQRTRSAIKSMIGSPECVFTQDQASEVKDGAIGLRQTDTLRLLRVIKH